MTGRLSRLSTAFADVVAAPCRCSLAAPPSRSRCWACRARRRTCKPPCRRSSKRCPPVSPRHRRVVRKSKPAVAKGCWLGWPAGRRPGQLGRGVALAMAASWPKPQASLLWTLLARLQQRALTSRGCLDPAGYLDRLSALALAHWETWETPAKGPTGLRPPQPARSCSPLLAERALSAVALRVKVLTLTLTLTRTRTLTARLAGGVRGGAGGRRGGAGGGRGGGRQAGARAYRR